MTHFKSALTIACTSILLSSCGGDNQETASAPVNTRGTLVQSSPTLPAPMSAAQFGASLQASPSGKELLQLTGAPTCGVDVQHLRFKTVGAKDEETISSAALMIPTGDSTQCTKERPVLLFAHGTNISKSYNLSNLIDPSNEAYPQALLLAAMYAAQGYIVVAPNYAGYADSTLGYHPYLNADQVSKEMIDALAAAKTALPALSKPVSASAKLFISGYSQGGHAAMATHRAMQRLGIPVTASAPMSGPYALAAMGDAIFYGQVNLSSTIFIPFILSSYQQAYGDLYTSPSTIYETAYANNDFPALLPGSYNFESIILNGKIPPSALFYNQAPNPALAAYTPPQGSPNDALFAAGFGASNLINNNTRLSYLSDALAHPDGALPNKTTGGTAGSPQNALRKALKRNDLRDFLPLSPVLLCGGSSDPTVYYQVNTELMQALWKTPGSPLQMPSSVPLVVLDVDSISTSTGPLTDPFYDLKAGFAQNKLALATTAAGASKNPAMEVTLKYHGELVPPFCNAAARSFFSQF